LHIAAIAESAARCDGGGMKVMAVVVVSVCACVMVSARAAAGDGEQTGVPIGIVGPVPEPARKQLDEVDSRLTEHDHDGAAQILDKLLAAYPAHVTLHVTRCQLELSRGGASEPATPAARGACERAVAISPEIKTAIDVAEIFRSRGDAATERAMIAAAAARLASYPPERAAAAWLTLADHYRDKEAVTWAEDAAVKAGTGASDRGIAAWAAGIRLRYGLPRDGTRYHLTPEDDVAALMAIRDVLSKSVARDLAAATKAADAAEKRWPGLPGLLAARCHIAIRRGALAAARPLCARSLAAAESSWGLYLSGVLELKGRGRPAAEAAVATMRKIIALDPDFVDAWDVLADALRRTDAISEVEQLRRDYRRRFHAAPPW
jgi:predicted Zn-dependent protease